MSSVATKILLFRNGHDEYRGHSYVFRKKRNQTIGPIIKEINSLAISSIPDNVNKTIMSRIGTKYIYDLEGNEITQPSQLKDGEKYVCCASRNFTHTNYGDIAIKITIVCVILAGSRPRKMIKVALANNMLPSFKGLKELLVRWLKISPDVIEAIHDIDGSLITSMRQLLRSHMAVVYANGVRNQDDFILSVREREYVRRMMHSHIKHPQRYKDAFTKPLNSDDETSVSVTDIHPPNSAPERHGDTLADLEPRDDVTRQLPDERMERTPLSRRQRKKVSSSCPAIETESLVQSETDSER